MARIRIGIGGWTYPPWRGSFYPDKLPQAKELEYASHALTAIEINATFYGRQKPKSWEAWEKVAPDGFQFAVKGSRYCVSRSKLAESAESIANFFGPFGARYLEQEARFAPVVHDPIEMGTYQARDALARIAGWIERCHHAGVIVLQDFQKQRARQFLLRTKEMKKAAIGGARAGADRSDGCALKAVAIEHGKARGEQIFPGGRDHQEFSRERSRRTL